MSEYLVIGEIIFRITVLIGIIIKIHLRHFVLYSQGHFVRALGKIGDKDTENEVLLLEHDVPHSKFSEAVLSCLPKLPWVITEKVSGIFFFLSIIMCVYVFN
jgi:exoribonuclease R